MKNTAAKRDYVRSRNKAFRNMMRVTKQQLLHTVRVYGIKGVKKRHDEGTNCKVHNRVEGYVVSY
jgi:hypothetical protein